MKKYNIAIVGATGNVGREILNILSERKFPFNNIDALASESSDGKIIKYGNRKTLKVKKLEGFSFKKTDIILSSAGSNISKNFALRAVKEGAIVIDNTSYFRMDKKIPLVVPEVNSEEIVNYKKKGIISNPNCSTIQMVVALKPLHDLFGIKRIVVSTYQSTSGSGKQEWMNYFTKL